MPKVAGNVIAITADHSFLHVGPADEMIAHLGIRTENVQEIAQAEPLKIFDEEASELTPRDVGGTIELHPKEVDGEAGAGIKVNEQHLMDDITLALALMQVAVNNDENNNDPDFRVPVIGGSLRVMLAGLAADFGPFDEDDNGGGKLHRKSRHPHF